MNGPRGGASVHRGAVPERLMNIIIINYFVQVLKPFIRIPEIWNSDNGGITTTY